MNAIIYLLQVSACLALFYGFYYIMLNRLTFFTINRYYLLFTLVISFIIPLLTIPVHEQYSNVQVMQQVVNMRSVQNIPVSITHQATTIKADASINWMQLLKWGYLLAVIGLFIHLLITLASFFVKLRRRKMSSVGNVHILRGDKKLPNGSFLNYIFLNDDELSAEEMEQIVAHEMLHVKLYHSADRILMKLVQITLWFNPFVYLYARSMEENHEFEVDREIITSNDKNKYADLLLHLSVANQGMLYHSFSKVPIKKRIVMLFNQPSAKVKRVVYVLVLPILVISCLAFARLKTDDPKPISAVTGIKDLGKKPLVLIDNKPYPASILYKISGSVIKTTRTVSGERAMKKYGEKAKDGLVVIATKKGKIGYMTPIEKENLTKIDSTGLNLYTRVKLKKENGEYYEMVKLTRASGGYASADMPVNGKVGFIINNKLYDEKAFKELASVFEKQLFHVGSGGAADKGEGFSYLATLGYNQDLSGYDAILFISEPVNLDKTGYNQQGEKSGKVDPQKKSDGKTKQTASQHISTDNKQISIISGVKGLGKKPLVLINGKPYPSAILYKIGTTNIKSTAVMDNKHATLKYGAKAKDGAVQIDMRGDKIIYRTDIERENLTKESAVPEIQFYTRLTLKKQDNTLFDRIIFHPTKDGMVSGDVTHGGKAAFYIDNKLYDENAIKSLSPQIIASLTGSYGTDGPKPADKLKGFEREFIFETTANKSSK